MRIVFMGTPDFALPPLESLMSSEHKVVAVYTQPDKAAGRGRNPVPPPVKKFALEHGVDVFQPLSLKHPEEREKLAQIKPDVIVTFAYGQLLPKNILDIPPQGCLNIHPSLLPRHRGPSPVAASILAGDEITGVSIMLMDEGMDTGPVLIQQQLTVSPKDTTGSLTEKLALIGADLLKRSLQILSEDELTPEYQDEEKATYSHLIKKEEGEIDWQQPAVEIWRRVRAFQPWPGCYTRWQGKLLKIISSTPLPGNGEGGRVISISDGQGVSMGVHTSEGVLGILQLQLEGKRAMTAEEFLRGQKTFIGASLPS